MFSFAINYKLKQIFLLVYFFMCLWLYWLSYFPHWNINSSSLGSLGYNGCWPLYPHNLEQCLTLSRCSANICWANKWTLPEFSKVVYVEIQPLRYISDENENSTGPSLYFWVWEGVVLLYQCFWRVNNICIPQTIAFQSASHRPATLNHLGAC